MMKDSIWAPESEERYVRLIELERLERNLDYARSCLRGCPPAGALAQLWRGEVRKAEFALKLHHDSRSKQTELSLE